MPPLDPFWADALPAQRYIYTSPLDFPLGISVYHCAVDADRLTIPIGMLHAGDKAFVISGAKLWIWEGTAWALVNSANRTAENKGLTTMLPGQLVSVHSSGTGVILASAASPAGLSVGVVVASISPGNAGPTQAVGMLTLADWTAATGTQALAANAPYYLSATPGLMTTAAPTVGIVQSVGQAVDPQTMLFALLPAVRL